MSIESVVKLLRQADKDYYTDGSSPLSEQEYDAKKDWLRKESPDHPYLDEVGAEDIDNSHWEKHTHEYPLGSLGKVQSIEELCEWYAKSKKAYLVVQLKLDGISNALTFENGKLVRAVTRGKNGVGDDITRNVKKMQCVPSEIDFTGKIIVRGEIIMRYDDFDKLPDNKKKKNARNTASGAAKKLSGELCSHLTFIAYDIMNAQKLGITTETECIDLLKSLGFETVVTTELSDDTTLIVTVNDLEAERNDLQYDIDGLVIKTNEMNFNDDWRHPKSKVAYKFAHQEVSTILEDVIISVKGNRIQPIAKLTPVDIGGVTVSKASLHNWKRVRDLGLTKGCKVLISRRNDVIPQVEQVLEQGTEEILLPTECPVCGTTLAYERNTDDTDSVYLSCPNEDCEAKIVKHVMKWLRIHDTKGIAEKTVQCLYDNGIFEDLAGFLSLHDGNSDEEIMKIEGMGQSKVNKMKSEIKGTLETNPVKYFAGMNLGGFGRRMFEKICDYIYTYQDEIDRLDIMQLICQPFDVGLQNVEGFALPSRDKLLGLIDDANERMCAVEAIVNIKPMKKEKLASNNLQGKSFCFTGALDIVRSEAQKLVKANGGTVKSSVSANLDYLVTDDPIDPTGGSSKMKKACKLGVQIITGEEFNNMAI